MASGPIKHGSEAGYNAERLTGNLCERCRAAHRVWSRRKGNKGKAEGLMNYKSYDVIDHLDLRRTPRSASATPRLASATPSLRNPGSAQVAPPEATDPSATPEAATPAPEPSLGDRLAERIRDLTVGNSPEYVPEQDTGYVHEIEDTDSPGPEWEPADDVEFVINAKAMATIQENLGTYLSIVGMTAEMIDPYCGGAVAANFDNMVSKWSKVIAHYPKAAALFMDGTGGIIFTWIGALQATWPVLYAIYQHHLAKTIAIAPNGQVYRKGTQPNPANNGQFVDPLQPEFQYSAS
jgi:hypothetical protein